MLPLLLSPLGTPPATGQEKAPRRPPEPFRVFVQTSDPADAALKTQLEEAVPMVRERVAQRRHWFQMAASLATADLTLRLVNYRTGELGEDHPHRQTGGMIPGLLPAEPDEWREYHFVDAVVQGGGSRANLSGLDVGLVKSEPDIRGAADHLARELERFAKDNYVALSRVKARANDKLPRGETPG